jgi:sec-independent protein translocase protein TatB
LYLLVLEGLGTSELLVILVVALILLGPRRLPQISRKIGKSIAEFKRTSEDFKRTWEREVEMESADKDARIEQAMLPAENSILDTTVGRENTVSMTSGQSRTEDESDAVENDSAVGDAPPVAAPSVTPVDASVMQPAASSDTPAVIAPTRKRDWL